MKTLTETQVTFLKGLSIALKIVVGLMIPIIIMCVVMLYQLLF